MTPEYHPLTDAIELVIGRKVHRCTALRWAINGIKGVKLWSRKIGGRRMTTVAAVEAFFDKCDQTHTHNVPQEPPPKLLTKKQAKRRLKELGLA